MRTTGKWFAVVTIAALCVAYVMPAIAAGGFIQPGAVIYWPDAFENDDTSGTAKVAPEVSERTFEVVDDHDWVRINATDGEIWTVETEMLKSNWGNDDDSGDFDTEIEVYRVGGGGALTEIAGDDDHDLFETYSSSLTFEATSTGTYLVDVHELDEDDRGAYRLYVNEGIGHRVYGATRYETSVAVSHRIFDMNNIYGDGVEDPERIVLASGANFADAVCGAALACSVDGVLLLTPPTSYPESVDDEITRLLMNEYIQGEQEQTTVYVLGGTAAISSGVMRQVAMNDLVTDVVRLSGVNRYETSAEIAYELDDYEGADTTAYVVNGEAWADALAVAPIAGYLDRPVFLTMRSDVPQAIEDAMDDLGITDVIVVGGTSVVDATAYAQLVSKFGAGNVDRIAGVNRYQTARLVAEHGGDEIGGDDPEAMVLTRGDNWPDALSAAALAYWNECPLLLTPGNSLSGEVTKFMVDNGIPDMYAENDYGDGSHYEGLVSYLVGGPAAVTNNVYHAWRTYKGGATYHVVP